MKSTSPTISVSSRKSSHQPPQELDLYDSDDDDDDEQDSEFKAGNSDPAPAVPVIPVVPPPAPLPIRRYPARSCSHIDHFGQNNYDK